MDWDALKLALANTLDNIELDHTQKSTKVWALIHLAKDGEKWYALLDIKFNLRVP
jgi:hypothetical protein